MGKKRVIHKSGDTGGKKSGASSGGVRARKSVALAIVHIQATYNNTLISFSDEKGDILAWSTAGAMGFSGAKKATPFAAARVIDSLNEKLSRVQIQDVTIRVSGVGSGRDSAIRALANHGYNIVSIKDITPVPHNGPRAKKVRRV